MKLKLSGALLVAALMQAPHASAVAVTASYFGIVDATQSIDGVTESAPDFDVAGLFGGGNLEGDFITATFAYNTSLGSETSTKTSDELLGGLSFSLPSPITSATFLIQTPGAPTNYTYSYTPDYEADVFVGSDDPDTGAMDLHAVAGSTNQDQSFVYIVPKSAPPSNLTSSFSAFGFGPGSYLEPGATNTGSFDNIVFDTLQLTVSAAPEPTGWALMIAGLALIGTALRLRRRRFGSNQGCPHDVMQVKP